MYNPLPMLYCPRCQKHYNPRAMTTGGQYAKYKTCPTCCSVLWLAYPDRED